MTNPNEDSAAPVAHRAPPANPETAIVEETLATFRAALNELSAWRNVELERTAKEIPDSGEHLLEGMRRMMAVAQAGFSSVERFSEAHKIVAAEMQQLQGVQMSEQELQEATASLNKRSLSLATAAEGHRTAAMHAVAYFDEMSARYWKVYPIQHGASPLVKH